MILSCLAVSLQRFFLCYNLLACYIGCASSLNTSTTESLSISDLDSTAAMPIEPYSNKVMDILNNAGWDFNLENVSTFSSPVLLCSVSHTLDVTTTAAGKRLASFMDAELSIIVFLGEWEILQWHVIHVLATMGQSSDLVR